MPSRLQTFNQRVWQGGLNTSLDATLLSPDELSIAQNVIFTTSGSRKSRGGIKFHSYTGVGVQRSSVGTTRTIRITFNDSSYAPSNGDYIAIWTNNSSNSNYDIKRVQITSITNTSGTTYDITYTMSAGLTEIVTADTTLRVITYIDDTVIGMKDFWFLSSGTKTQKRVVVLSDGTFHLLASTGSLSPISTSGLSITAPLTGCSFAVLGNKLLIALEGGTTSQNKPVIWSGSGNITHPNNLDYAGTNVNATNAFPNLKYLQVHQSRVWGIVKSTPDQLVYSDINNLESWQGEADSGAILPESGDDDYSGITAIFPPFKGTLLFAKGNKLYRVDGELPFSTVNKISDGVGCVSHNSAVAIDQDDVVFISRKGIHSLSATGDYGDFAGAYLSSNIQSSFNSLELSIISKSTAQYIPSLNSILFCVPEDGESNNNVIYLLNLTNINGQPSRRWYKWSVNDDDYLRFVSIEAFKEDNSDIICFGNATGIIYKYNENSNTDLVNDDIVFIVKTGIIYPDNDPTKIKGFKQAGIIYKTERENVDFYLIFKVDNYQSQSINITQDASSDLLNTTFILGQSTLGSQQILLPEYVSVDGYGYGCILEIQSTNPLELYGYLVNYEMAGDSQEVIREG